MKHVNIHFDVTFSIIFMMVVFTLSTIIHVVVILYMKSSTPGRFRHPWFGGVTDWYQSIVYSELSISNHIRYTNYKCIGTRVSDFMFSKQLYF